MTDTSSSAVLETTADDIIIGNGIIPSSSLSFVVDSSALATTTTDMPNLLTIISTIGIVTCSDMIPFIPCQPLAIALGASPLGIWAYPICVIGQTFAGIIAFTSARRAVDSNQVQKILDTLNDDVQDKFLQFRQLGMVKTTQVDSDYNNEKQQQQQVVTVTEDEIKVFLALIGLRLAPFFPFSAGNYLLGSTGVGLRPFAIATIFGCLLSNALSVGIGVLGDDAKDKIIDALTTMTTTTG